MHRLDVGTSGLMAVAKSERAYTSLKRQFQERTVDKRYHALVQGHPDPMSGTIDAPIGRHPNHDYKWAVTAGGQALRHALRPDRGLPRRLAARHQAGDRPHPPDPRAHVRAPAPVRRRPDLRRRPDDRQAARPDPAVAARGAARLRAPRRTGSGWSSRAPTPTDLQQALDEIRGGERVSAGRRYAVRVADDPRPTVRRASRCARRSSSSSSGVPEDIEYDAYDAGAVHVLAVRRRTGRRWAPGGCCTGAAAAGQDRRRPSASARWAGSRSTQGRARAGRRASRWCGPIEDGGARARA